MKFKWVVLIGLVMLGGIFSLYLPRILVAIKHDPDIISYTNSPDVTYGVFNRCKQQVDDVNKCYAAYSAVVIIAESTDCSSESVRLKRQFKLLLDPHEEDKVEREIINDCHGKINPATVPKSNMPLSHEKK